MKKNFLRRRVLVALLALLIALAVAASWAGLQVRATTIEQSRALPGDELIANPIGSVNHAITIRRPPHDVWPWLVQMGSGRAGWYSYDFIDNGSHHSAEHVIPDLQNIKVGSVLPALPGVPDVFVVAQCDPEHSLVLCWRLPNGKYQTTWAFVLEQPQPNRTRLMVRGRIASEYHPFGLPQWLALSTGRLGHFIMERKQLLGIARRAESASPDNRARAAR